MGYCTDSTPRNGPYNSFKSPLLQQQKPEEQAKPDENPIDPRLKNIGRAHDMFSRLFRIRIYKKNSIKHYVIFVLIFSKAWN